MSEQLKYMWLVSTKKNGVFAQNGGPYADTLIVDLPTDSQKRRDLFRISNEESEKEGFEPETDGGQNELWFWWD